MKQLHEMHTIPEILQEIQIYVDEIKRLQHNNILPTLTQDALIMSFSEIQKIISNLVNLRMSIETIAQRKGIQFLGDYPNIKVQITEDMSTYKQRRKT